MSLLEALAAIQLLVNITPAKRQQLNKGLIRYFFLNPVKISSCPFLDDQVCLIYEDRFFGCRAYGLWSRRYYEEQAARSRQAKRLSQKQWQGLGVSLPQEVVDFYLPYCTEVELEGSVSMDDDMILEVSETIEGFSGQLTPWHEIFRQGYFADLSFLMASLEFGMQKAIQLKFQIVRDIRSTGNHNKVEDMVDKVSDLFGDLTP
jgi:Fe-S-cluster containining protein